MTESDINKVALPKREVKLSNNYPDLKRMLLAGEITPVEFFRTLAEIDNSSSNRVAAFANYNFIKDPEIQNFRKSQGYIKKYCIFLSFSAFHCAQYRANEQNNFEAKKFFIEALSHRLGVMEPKENYYILATIAYFDQNIPLMKALRDSMGNGSADEINISVIDRLINGLEKYGTINYERDYLGVSSKT